MFYVDATCPLVSKVHAEARDHFENGCEIVLIGHAGHPEVIGTMGQLAPGAMTLVQTAEEARTVMPDTANGLAFITQTTLSVDDTAEVVAILRSRFPDIRGPKSEDICYATTNRQAAVKAIAAESDLVIVIGSANSSNSQRLREVAERAGTRAVLLPTAVALEWSLLSGVTRLGISAGASAPELLVDQLLERLREHYALDVSERRVVEEDVVFKLPAPLA
jgi:4-hydroxy-3-methylbut-2-enyl diphosphate reductase